MYRMADCHGAYLLSGKKSLDYFRAIPFEILRGGRMETKGKNVWGAFVKKRKIKCVLGRPGFFPVRPPP